MTHDNGMTKYDLAWLIYQDMKTTEPTFFEGVHTGSFALDVIMEAIEKPGRASGAADDDE